MVAACEGDARAALTTVEVAVALARAAAPTPTPGSLLTMDDMARARDGRLFHQGADEHYDQISALIKSVRGSDPDAGLYWMARMIEAGEDPRFLARRMVILASEDIGLADPQALLVAEAAARAVEYVGLPEAALNLAEAVIYLARAPKSNAVVVALGRAQADVRSEREPGGPGPPARRPLQGRRRPWGTARATSTRTTTPPGWSPSSIVLTRSRDGCTTSRRPTVRKARAGQAGAGRPIREAGCSGGPRWSAPRSARRRSAGGRAGPRRRGGRRRRRASRPDRPAAGRARSCPPAPRSSGAAAGRPGAQPRRGPGRAEPRRPGPGRRGGVDARVARLPPLPDVGAVSRPQFGPSPAEVAQVSSVLRSEGLTVGTPDAGQHACCR